MKKILKWLDNYWYHYKWTTIIVTFLLAVAIVGIVQFAKTEEYDAYVQYVGGESISETRYQDLRSSLNRLAGDYSGDGKVNVNFSKLAYITDKDNVFASEVNASAKEQLASMAVLPYYIYIMPAEVYLLYKDTGIFESLSEIFGENIPDFAYDDCALYYSETALSKNYAGGAGFSDDTVIALKVTPYIKNKSDAKKELEKHSDHLGFFKNIAGNG